MGKKCLAAYWGMIYENGRHSTLDRRVSFEKFTSMPTSQCRRWGEVSFCTKEFWQTTYKIDNPSRLTERHFRSRIPFISAKPQPTGYCKVCCSKMNVCEKTSPVVAYRASTLQVWGFILELGKVDSAFIPSEGFAWRLSPRGSLQTDHLIRTSAHAPQCLMVAYTEMGTVSLSLYGLLRQ
ncbi:hypothetical protein TNCV_3303371 [Trichonephila clavipes]|nr:hypothetical protein TNCV_3303371 [Trichonephila clavipes]